MMEGVIEHVGGRRGAAGWWDDSGGWLDGWMEGWDALCVRGVTIEHRIMRDLGKRSVVGGGQDDDRASLSNGSPQWPLASQCRANFQRLPADLAAASVDAPSNSSAELQGLPHSQGERFHYFSLHQPHRPHSASRTRY